MSNRAYYGNIGGSQQVSLFAGFRPAGPVITQRGFGDPLTDAQNALAIGGTAATDVSGLLNLINQTQNQGQPGPVPEPTSQAVYRPPVQVPVTPVSTTPSWLLPVGIVALVGIIGVIALR